MTANFQHLRIEPNGNEYTTLWLDVAERKVNVFSEVVVDELQAAIDELGSAREMTPIVIRSAKPGGFLAGADLRQLAAFRSAADVDRFLQRGPRLLDCLEQLPRPTVAAIHGACLGGGLELALACRYRIARDDPATRLGLPETRLQLTPAWGGTRRLPRLIGLESALRMMLTGEAVNVAAAQQLGLVDAVGRADHFDADIGQFVRHLPEMAVRRSPELLTRRQRLRVMAAARRQYGTAPSGTPAQRAVLGAVDAGYEDSQHDERATVRDDFVCLVLSDECRRRLAEFFR